MTQDVSNYSHESIARQSANTVTFDQAGLEEALAQRTAAHDQLFGQMIDQPDGDLAGILATGADTVRRIAAPFRERAAAIMADVQAGVLTPYGASQRAEALKQAFAQQLDEQGINPMKNTLAAAAQRFTGMLVTPAPTDQQRAAATAIAQELQLLTPQRGVIRVGEVLTQAAKSDDFGVVRVLLPFVRSLLEREGSAWYGSQAAFALVVSAEEALRPWMLDVGESRLEDCQWLEYQLGSLRQAAIESYGDIDRSPRFLLGDFKAGKIRRSTDNQNPRNVRIARAQRAAARNTQSR
jgi:hypothetical protein